MSWKEKFTLLSEVSFAELGWQGYSLKITDEHHYSILVNGEERYRTETLGDLRYHYRSEFRSTITGICSHKLDLAYKLA